MCMAAGGAATDPFRPNEEGGPGRPAGGAAVFKLFMSTALHPGSHSKLKESALRSQVILNICASKMQIKTASPHRIAVKAKIMNLTCLESAWHMVTAQ